ncbi:MAG: sugar transferase [Verrucomicrobiota bacterium]|nr:sugar transferase [Limisphaera sp.]MDW8380832.1 sugar transferase [Verrucomicrobiota bacterium]
MQEQIQAVTLSVGQAEASSPPLPLWKRLLDVACIVVSLPVTLPLAAAIAAFIKLTSPGPVLFRQERIGYRGQRFWCLKFRTMQVNADTACHQQHLRTLIQSDVPMLKLDVKGDRRLIRGGAFLRATGLDELPQLINVLRGEMSLVGPRPCLPYEYEQYDAWARRRCEAVPGLTGLWQVSGKNHTTFRRMIELDIEYAQTKSLWLDLRIMLKTFSALAAQVRETRAAVRTPASSSPATPAVPAANGAAKAA